MSNYKDQGFNERLGNAANAKRILLEKFKTQPRPDDPAIVEQRLARQALVAARDARMAERKAARAAEAARTAAEKVTRDAALKAEQALHAAAAERARIELLAQQKAARDARYAARKARGKR